MRKIVFLLGLTLTLCVACTPKNNTLSQVEQAEGWQLLFDGETTNGWRPFNGETLSGWIVEDGTLVGLGKGGDIGGDIVSTQEFANFELAWEWKIDAQGNSGIMYHVVEGENFGAPYLSGPEYQMIDDMDFPQELEVWQQTGADYAMHPADPAKKIIKPAGQWNSSRILFDNGHVEHWLNGEKVVEFEAWTNEWFELKNAGKWNNAPEYGLARSGRFCLQDHGSKVWFRNVKVRELPKEPKEYNLFNGEDLTGWINFGQEKWFVEDSLIVSESGPAKEYGYLATREYFDDFDLTVEFKQESDGNSGIFFRSTIEDTKIAGWQVEVAPPNHDSGGIYESYGRGWLVQIPDEKENILKYGEWNTMRVRLEGDHVQTWLNGEPMVDLTDETIGQGKGRIALQIHSGGNIRVVWRNLFLKEL
jgi:hypothetical protein